MYLSTFFTCHGMFFSMYLHRICLFCLFLRDLLIFFLTYRSCLHSLHVMGWFPYLFPVISIIFICCTILKTFLDSSVCTCLHLLHILGGFPIYFCCIRVSLLKYKSFFPPKFDHRVSCLRSYTLLRCNEMHQAGNLLFYCALYD